jgi:hypothetical protein
MPNSLNRPPDLLWPDDELAAKWAAEAMANLPDPVSWVQFYIGWRWAEELHRRQTELDRRRKKATEEEEAELKQQQIAPPECPPGLHAIHYAMLAFWDFLLKQRRLHFVADGHPVARLMTAIGGLAGGGSYVPGFLKPRERAPGSPGKGDGIDFIKGVAARAYERLVAGGQARDEAGRLVASALRQASEGGLGPITGATVRNWQARAEQGPGPGASEWMVAHYREPLGPCLGSTPLEQGRALLAALEARAASYIS